MLFDQKSPVHTFWVPDDGTNTHTHTHTNRHSKGSFQKKIIESLTVVIPTLDPPPYL